MAVRYSNQNVETAQLNLFGFKGEIQQINHCASFFSILEEIPYLNTTIGVVTIKQIAQSHDIVLSTRPKFVSAYLIQNIEDKCFLEI